MATTSAAGLALRRHVIPLVSLFNDQSDNTKVSLMRSVNIGDGNNEKRKYSVPFASSQDVETLCRCVLELDDVSAIPRLSLTTGPLKFSYFQQCLGGTIRDKWDVLADGRNETVANFQLVCNELIAELVRPTDLADQRHYLETSKKPYKLNCAALSARLETINKMMALFPGAGGNPPMQVVDIKNLYYQMMPSEWQRVFLNSGQVITDPNYTSLSLQHFMTLQEEQNQADVARRRQLQQRNPRSRGGRSGRSPNCRRAPGGASPPSTRYQASGAIPAVPLAASPAQGGPPAPFRGFARPPYQGQRSYGRGQPYHPYSRPLVLGRGHGHGRHGSDMYQVQVDVLPPVAANMHHPEGNPPDDLHFADGDYSQNSVLDAPELERWVTGYSNDSSTPKSRPINQGQFMTMPLNPTTTTTKKIIIMVMMNDPTRKLFQTMDSFL